MAIVYPLTYFEKAAMHERQGGYCKGCWTQFEVWEMEVDHIIPTSLGGSDNSTNLQLLCRKCNRRKSDKPPFNPFLGY